MKPSSKELVRSNVADVERPKLKVLSDADVKPVETLMSHVIPSRDFGQPAHRISRRVDSRSEMKSSSSPSRSSAPPNFFGSSFTHTTNAQVRPYVPKPSHPTIPQVRPVLVAEQFQNEMMLNNRTSSGQILGSPLKRYIPSQHVPFLAPDIPVGPDNPSKDIDETWMSCWDREVCAVYYYNKITKEATWINPFA